MYFLKFILILAAILPMPALSQEVWLNTNSGVYHCPGTRWYHNTKSGKLIKESVARVMGNRPAYGKICFPSEVISSKNVLKKHFEEKSAIKVWVNSKSNIYHCPNSQYFKNTKRGYLIEEVLALEKGNRPAHGIRCSR